MALRARHRTCGRKQSQKPKQPRSRDMAKNFAICRVEKRTDIAQVGRSEAHNLRGFKTAHVNPKADAPRILFGAKGLTTQLREVLPEKRRKDAVLAFEVFLGASPEWFAAQSPEQVEAWALANVEWLKTRFGANLMQIVLHTDEQTPHLHAYCHPVQKDGSLSYFKMLGSPKLLTELQTDYALSMKHLGLRRGLTKSTATHEETAKWRAENKKVYKLPPLTDADIPKATAMDHMNPEAYVKKTLETFLKKITRQLSKTLKAAGDNAKTHQLNEELLARLGELEARIEAEETKTAVYRKMLASLIGFEPDIDTMQGQQRALEAIKAARKKIRGEADIAPAPQKPTEAPNVDTTKRAAGDIRRAPRPPRPQR